MIKRKFKFNFKLFISLMSFVFLAYPSFSFANVTPKQIKSLEKKSIPRNDLVTRNGLLYQKFTDVPYNGTALQHVKGRKTFLATYQDGIQNGLIIWYNYDINYNNNQYIPDGYSYTYYKKNKRNGKHISYFGNGQIRYKAEYKNGRKTGKTINYFRNGNIKQLTIYKKNGLESEQTVYYDSGEINKKGFYKNNKKEGEWKYYYRNGQIIKTNRYKSGKLFFKDGEHFSYHENGKVARKYLVKKN